MYNLPYYRESKPEIIKEFIRLNPFAFVSGSDEEHKPVATQVPVFVEEENGKQVLRGHIMKNTDHHLAFLNNEHVLVVFTGAHTYVSGTWYSNPYTPSTWNFMSVQVKGRIRFLDDTCLLEVLRMTSMYFEGNNEDSPTILDNLPEDYVKRMTKAIVAFEIEIQDMDAVFKLSQDRDEESYVNIINNLRKGSEHARFIAEEMERRRRRVFPQK